MLATRRVFWPEIYADTHGWDFRPFRLSESPSAFICENLWPNLSVDAYPASPVMQSCEQFGVYNARIDGKLIIAAAKG